MVRDFFWDDEFRPKFDPMLIHSETLEKSHTTGTMVVQWVRKVTNFLLKHCRGPTPLLAYNRLLLAICSFRSSAVTESTLLAAGYGSVKEHFTVWRRYRLMIYIPLWYFYILRFVFPDSFNCKTTTPYAPLSLFATFTLWALLINRIQFVYYS